MRKLISAMVLCLTMAFGVTPAQAAFPAAYAPMTVEPQVKDGMHEFDLRPAQARARREKKSLYVYLGAHNCPYCRRYEAFLTEQSAALVPHFAKDYLVVDLRSDLRVTDKRLMIRTEALHLPYTDFQKTIGDERTRVLTYPSVWLLSPDGKPLMQMPSGAGTFETVPEQLEILRLVN